MRRAAANLLHRVVADGIGQPAALPAAFAPYYRDAAVVLRHSGIQQPALTDGANRPTVVVEHLRAQRGAAPSGSVTWANQDSRYA